MTPLPHEIPGIDAPIVPSIAAGTVFPHAGGEVDVTIVEPFEFIHIGDEPKAAPPNDPVAFLEMLRPGGPWLLSAFVPDDGAKDTRTLHTAAEAKAFVAKYHGKRNIYYSVNPTRKPMNKKAAKTDIARIEYVPADLDPKSDETPEAAKVRYLAGLDALHPPPTAIIDSGNGLNVLLKLAEPIILPEPVTVTKTNGKGKQVQLTTFPAETEKQIADVETRAKILMEALGSVAGTQNIDRILRLPGTINLPNEKKAREGRVVCPTRLIKFNGATCRLDDFPAAPVADELPLGGAAPDDAGGGGSSDDLDWTKVAQYAGWLKSVADLPDKFSTKGRTIIAHDGNLADLNYDLQRSGLLAKPYATWSDISFALAAIFKNDGRFGNEQIAAALMCDLNCNRHIAKLHDQVQRRAVERLITRSYDPSQQAKTAARFHSPYWREQRDNGSPVPSMHNARLAIAAMGVDCSYDTFHNKMLFGYKDENTRHAIEQILGEVSDNGIISLRRLLSDRFGFDLTERHVRDAVISLALEHCFDPVADMLDWAQANWDRKARLDRMAVDYFNCADTKLNRACVRKTMVAAVARVRNPGCKFDTILTLEAPEGENKSTAWKVLAVEDENFSDEKIIGKDSREVQEQLASVWIHENAELAGMRKAEVETVKAFASRTVDSARPAFGHFLKKQPRHSIEVATTNSDEYLLSQTGNRRFWPMKVLKAIDIAKLERDRLLLWGEAAYYQSQGEAPTIDEALWPAAAVEQEKRRSKDAWEDVLADIPWSVETRHYDEAMCQYITETHQIIHVVDGQDITGRKQERVASHSLLTYVLRIRIGDQEHRHTQRLADAMKHLGWQRDGENKVTIAGKQVRGYFRWIKPSA